MVAASEGSGADAGAGGGWSGGVCSVWVADRAGDAVGRRACRRRPEQLPRARAPPLQSWGSSGEAAEASKWGADAVAVFAGLVERGCLSRFVGIPDSPYSV